MTRATKKAPRRRWRTAVLAVLAMGPILVVGLWVAIHRVPWLGPLLADTARSVVGPGPIAKLEDVAYGVEDRWNRVWRRNDVPEAYWEVPEPVAPPTREAAVPQLPPFRMQDVPPMHKAWSAPGDGVWVPVEDKLHPGASPRMFKTLLHPDRNRSWTAVTVVAVDLRQVRLHLVAGRWEPKATEKDGLSYKRTGIVPDSAHDDLLGAFNGGFKLEHGRYGMRVDGVTLVRPRPKACTIAMDGEDRVEVGSWERFAERHEQLTWWRQTPACMWEQGKLHVGLRVDDNTAWGATVDGDTIIRRSALGVREDGEVLYVGIGDSTTARAMAMAMSHAGAYEVAQLDVNWSFPKFLTFERRDGAGELVGVPIAKGFEYEEDDFVRKPYARDFFYLTRKSTEEIARAAGEGT